MSPSGADEPGPLRASLAFLRQTMIWWLLPVIVVGAVFALIVFSEGANDAPFAYSIF